MMYCETQESQVVKHAEKMNVFTVKFYRIFLDVFSWESSRKIAVSNFRIFELYFLIFYETFAHKLLLKKNNFYQIWLHTACILLEKIQRK